MAKKVALNGFTPPQLANALHAVPDDADDREHVPNVLACLLPVYREGKLVRADGRISIGVSGRYWRVTLSCPSEAVECSVESPSLLNAMHALEDALRNGRANWRADYKARQKAGRVSGH